MRTFLALILTFAATALQADLLYLKNGGTISGKIVGVSQSAVTIQTDGGAQTVAKAAVRRIVYGAVEDPAAARKKQEEARKKQEEERKRQEELLKDLEKRREEELRRRQEELDRLQKQPSVTPAPTPQPEPEGGITRLGAITRSAILPGWGQFYQGRALGGGLYAGSMLALAGSGAYAAAEYSAARSAYRSSANLLFYTSPLVADQVGQSLPVSDDAAMFLIDRRSGVSGAAAKLGSQNKIAAYFMIQELSRFPLNNTEFAKTAFYFNALSQSMLQKQAMQRSAAMTNSIATAALGLYLWNIADAALFHPTSSSYIGLVPMDGQAKVAFGLYF